MLTRDKNELYALQNGKFIMIVVHITMTVATMRKTGVVATYCSFRGRNSYATEMQGKLI